MTSPTPFDQPSTIAKATDPEGGDGAYSFDGKPDRWKRYRLPHPETGVADGFTRATTFAKSISDTYRLSLWQQRMAVIGVAVRPDLLMQVASTPPDQREKLDRLVDDAKEAAGAKVGANLGTALHAFSEAVDRGEKPNIPPPYRPHLAAYTTLLKRYNLEVVDIERVVLCQQYDGKGVAGTLDRIARFTKDTTVEVRGGGSYTFKKGTLVILDLKTGKDLEYGWLEISVQLATYANAEVRFDKTEKVWMMMPPEIDKNVALVVHLPATAPGESVVATMYAVDIAAGHELAALCTQVRDARKRKGLATALAVIEEPGVMPVTIAEAGRDDGIREDYTMRVESERVAEIRIPTMIERARNAVTEADLQAIWFDAVRRREDSRELAEAIRERKTAILADSAAG